MTPKVTNGAGELGKGKVVQTTKNCSTGKINTPGTQEAYK